MVVRGTFGRTSIFCIAASLDHLVGADKHHSSIVVDHNRSILEKIFPNVIKLTFRRADRSLSCPVLASALGWP